jgi:hypothetical protein
MGARDTENKNREDFHTANYPQDPLQLSPSSLKKAEDAAKALTTEDKTKARVNHDTFDIPAADFAAELEHLPMRPHSNIVLVLGPTIKAEPTKSGLMLDERSVKQKQAEELDRVPSGMRVIAISKDLPPQSVPSFTVGDYIFTFSDRPLMMLNHFVPKNPEYAYYEFKTTDIRYSMSALKVQELNVTTE